MNYNKVVIKVQREYLNSNIKKVKIGAETMRPRIISHMYNNFIRLFRRRNRRFRRLQRFSHSFIIIKLIFVSMYKKELY